MVEPVVEPLRRCLRGVALSAPRIPYVSCVTGEWIRPEQATSPDYWARHAREPVRFADGIATASASENTILVEVGPGTALSTLATQAIRGRKVPVVSSMQDAARERDDRDCLLEALGRAWTYGALPDWAALHDGSPKRVSLPTYPFERARHWIAAPKIDRGPVSAAVAAAANAPQLPTIQDESVMNQNSVNDRLSEVGAAIAAIFEDLSGERPAATDAQTSFLEMGYDSLFLTQVAQKIQSQMKVKITFRQLLGEFSTIPALAAFLAEKLPLPAATAAARAPAAAPTFAAAAAPAPPPATAVHAGAGDSGMESLFRDQLQAMSQLINRQFEILQSVGGTTPVVSPAAASTSVVSPAAASPVTGTPARALRTAT